MRIKQKLLQVVPKQLFQNNLPQMLCSITFYLSLRMPCNKILVWHNFDEVHYVGTEVVPYECPKPIAGIHRFVLVLFRQTIRQTIDAPGWRSNFNTRDFAQYNNLGSPVAAVFFNCQRENGCGGRRYR